MNAPAYSQFMAAVQMLSRSFSMFRRFGSLEDIVLSLLLAAMIVLPLTEIILRKTMSVGIEGVTDIVQHLTLAISALGGAVAARESRLLSLSTTSLLQGKTKQFATAFSASCASAVVLILTIASIRFVQIEKDAGQMLAYDFPLWVAQLVLPVGFCLIAYRLLKHAADHLALRALATLIAGAVVAAAIYAPLEPESVVPPALCVLFLATILGAPIFAALGGAAAILLWGIGVPIASITVDHYSLVANPSLPTIPMFTLAGYLLAESGAPRRLVDVFHAVFGQLRGGVAIVTVLACTFFTCFTGASGVTILALGGLVMPMLLSSGYREKSALGLVTSAGSAGVILLPALPLILYSIVAKVSMESMFLGGVLPALLIVGLIAWWCVGQEPRTRPNAEPFAWRKARAAIWAAKWELILPAVPIVSLFSGLATPVEAAAVTALYAFLVVTVVHRDLDMRRDVPRVFSECGLLVGGILLILGVALGLTNYLVDAEIPDQLIALVTSTIEQRWVFLLALNGFLLFIGCIMDIFSAIVIVAPLIVPMGLAFGIDPVHLGIIFLANLELGYLTPPVGMNLFFSAYRFDKSIAEICRSVVRPFAVLCIGVLFITYLPGLSTFLPQLLR